MSSLLRRKSGRLTELVFLGAGGTARDVLSLVKDLNRNQEQYRCVALLDDDKKLWGRKVQGVPIVGPLADAKRFDSAQFVNTLGSPRNYQCRCDVPARLGLSAKRFETLIHPTAALSTSATVGEGTIILPYVVLLSGVAVGDQVLILAGSILNHDVRVGDYAVLASAVNLSGAVEIGSCSYIGSGACLIQGIRVGDNALVGMGAVVLKNVAPSTVVVGNPARPLSKTRLSSS
jgi:sugar O-acyltransferase (sialic acid O-acetyltransferase NeuD family)